MDALGVRAGIGDRKVAFGKGKFVGRWSSATDEKSPTP
jgi:hypothetical protein